MKNAMKRTTPRTTPTWTAAALSVLLALLLAACTAGAVKPNAVTYALEPVGGSTVEGFVTFEKLDANETTVTIDVDGTDPGTSYPAHIHEGDVGSGGAIYVPLTSVDGSSGVSATVVSENASADAVTYEDLVNFDGYVNVHLPDGTVIASGEIGEGANAVQIPGVLSADD